MKKSNFSRVVLLLVAVLISMAAFSQQVWRFKSTQYANRVTSDNKLAWETAYTNFYIGDGKITCTAGIGVDDSPIVFYIDHSQRKGKDIFYDLHNSKFHPLSAAITVEDDGRCWLTFKFTDDYFLWYYVPAGNAERVK